MCRFTVGPVSPLLNTGVSTLLHCGFLLLLLQFQTAEGIRAAGYPDWFQLIGLIHDIGKLQFLWGEKEDGMQGTGDGDQWALGGDTWCGPTFSLSFLTPSRHGENSSHLVRDCVTGVPYSFKTPSNSAL